MKVDVIIPLYNNGLTIDDTLDSVCGQTLFAEANVYVQDDGSTDDSAARVERWTKRYGNIHLSRNATNLGVKANYRTLIARGDSPFIAPIEGDDRWISIRRLETLVTYLATTGRPACFSAYLVDDHVLGTNRLNPQCESLCFERISAYALLDDNAPASFSNCVYRRDAMTAAFDLAGDRSGYDWLINTLIADQHEGFDYVPEILSSYRVSNSGTWSSLSDDEKAALISQTLSSLAEIASPRLVAEMKRRRLVGA